MPCAPQEQVDSEKLLSQTNENICFWLSSLRNTKMVKLLNLLYKFLDKKIPGSRKIQCWDLDDQILEFFCITVDTVMLKWFVWIKKFFFYKRANISGVPQCGRGMADAQDTTKEPLLKSSNPSSDINYLINTYSIGGGTWPDLRISQGSLYNLVLLSVKLGEVETKNKNNDWAGHRPICISENKGFAVVNVVS